MSKHASIQAARDAGVYNGNALMLDEDGVRERISKEYASEEFRKHLFSDCFENPGGSGHLHCTCDVEDWISAIWDWLQGEGWLIECECPDPRWSYKSDLRDNTWCPDCHDLF